MKWIIEYIEEDRIVYLKASGILVTEEINQLVKEIGEKLVRHKAHLVLSDITEMVPEMSKLEIDELPRIMSKNGLSRKDKQALVIDIDSKKLDDFAFFKASSTVQGFKVKLFTDIDKAKTWLLKDAPIKIGVS